MKLDKIMNCLPHFCCGSVVKGFGRGSKELGIPTANFPESVVDKLPDDMQTGIYYGWAQVDNGDVHKMVMSVGWNPFYKNTKKSMETHIMHDFGGDFYGSILKLIILGYIRPEQNFTSIDNLISAIHNDINIATAELSKQEMVEFSKHSFFQDIASITSKQPTKGQLDVTADKVVNGFQTKET
uniref:Riboflavin kinase n=1 Tax=Phallusia mammillata TaxID=59560 RepID=A0A6F9DR94_9ASCI|nr:riboflavin kinase [Phallusia mammillata]